MLSPVRPRTRVIAALAATATAVGAVVVHGSGGGPAAPHGELVRAERGDVAITVGGIGHVNTLAGAARLSVSGGSGSGGGAAGGSAAGGSATSGGGAAGPASSANSQAPADAVFPAVSGHVARLLVRAGDRVRAGEPVATIADDGAVASAIVQARSDVATAQLELAQKRLQDPARGQPPTAAELTAGRQAIVGARDRLRRVTGRPLAADVAAAKLEVAKAALDLRSVRAGQPESRAAAQLAVTVAAQKLALLTGPPNPADVAAAQLELAKATLEQETLLHPAPDAAPPTQAARTAAQLAVDVARLRLDQVPHPPEAVVTAARQELAKAQFELAATSAARGTTGLAAANAAVAAAKRKLDQVLTPPREVVSAARSDLGKAQSDLSLVKLRGASASATDLALARLKLDVVRQRMSLAQDTEQRLTVVSNASGTVSSVLTAPGTAVDSATPLIRVQDLAHLVVTLDLSEFDVGRTRVGAPVRISADALGGKEFGGHILDIARSGTDNGGVVNFPVIIALNSSGRLRPGMSVSARIIVARHRGVVRVPLDAVERGDRPSVMVGHGPGGLSRRVVKLGLANAQYVEVRAGLAAGEKVLSAGGGP